MAKKKFYCIVDTETTVEDTVADFAAVICDTQGRISTQCAIIIKGEFEKGLFFDNNNPEWSKARAIEKAANYNVMLNNGIRMAASVPAINTWLAKAIGKYNPILTAYNLPFDVSKCANSQIDLTGFADRFCLWSAAVGNICNTKAYKQFVLENHLFNSPTQYRNMTFSTNAESVAGFLNGSFMLEPHTALEDAINFELPILKTIIAKRGWREKIKSYNWKDFQVKDNYITK